MIPLDRQRRRDACLTLTGRVSSQVVLTGYTGTVSTTMRETTIYLIRVITHLLWTGITSSCHLSSEYVFIYIYIFYVYAVMLHFLLLVVLKCLY